MSRFRRRLIIGGTVLAVLLTAAGAWFYFVYLGSTGAALHRAESFLFRRMTVAQLGERGSYRYFYTTNRRPVNQQGPLEERFDSARGEELRFGSFDTEIEPSLGLGMLINPTDWFQNEEIQIRNVEPLDEQQFVERIGSLVDQSPFRSLLVVVHGFRERFPTALRKTAFLGHILDINAPVLLFDWPGDQGSSLAGYRRAHQVARESGGELAATLELIIREIAPERVWLVANSMGAQVVADAFSILYQQPDLADAETEIEDVVLTAPDVDHDEFDQQFKQEIIALAKNLTVYVSSNDRALLISRLVNRGRRRGESSLSPDQLEEAARISELIEPDSDLITLVDVTPVNRTRNFHNFSLETPEFFDDLYLRLGNQFTPYSRLLYRIETPEEQVYWILTRGR
ncbi:MAG: alpha/beta fold hydrolase [Gammaproteobacteria bacterium]|nr:MAG: alpha/beta fold hydrolase [Gammaproteobacteria bacterium]